MCIRHICILTHTHSCIYTCLHTLTHTAAQFPGASAEKPRVLEAAELRGWRKGLWLVVVQSGRPPQLQSMCEPPPHPVSTAPLGHQHEGRKPLEGTQRTDLSQLTCCLLRAPPLEREMQRDSESKSWWHSHCQGSPFWHTPSSRQVIKTPADTGTIWTEQGLLQGVLRTLEG